MRKQLTRWQISNILHQCKGCCHHGKQYGKFAKKRELPFDPIIPVLDIYQKNKNINLKIYMYPDIQSSIIYNAQDMEAA